VAAADVDPVVLGEPLGGEVIEVDGLLQGLQRVDELAVAGDVLRVVVG
jgi:hypothetical protein